MSVSLVGRSVMSLDAEALRAPSSAETFGARWRPGGKLLNLHRLLGLLLIISAFVGLPRRVNLGPISGMGSLTIAEVVLLGAGIFVCGGYPKPLLVRILPYWGFLFWAAASALWAVPDFGGIQNGVVYLMFGLALLLAGTLARRNASLMEYLIGRIVPWMDWIALTLVLRDLVANGLPNDPEEGWLVGPRPLAVLGLVMLSWHLSSWYFGSRHSRLPIALWLLAILFSMSRTGIAVALFLVALVVILQTRFRPSRAALSAPALIVAISLTTAVVAYSTAFNDRFFAGASTQMVDVAGVEINTSGRINMWRATIESAMQSPFIGHGLGSSQRLIEGLFVRMQHPHNDYLRIWHDLGAVGLVLVVTALGSWVWILFRAWYDAEKRGTRCARVELSGLLLLLALGLVMVPDNALIYPFIMGPAGILIGTGLGASLNSGRSPRRGAAARPAGIGPLG